MATSGSEALGTITAGKRQFLSVAPWGDDDDADLFVFVNDLAAPESYQLVERAVDVVSAVDCDRAWHGDRELI